MKLRMTRFYMEYCVIARDHSFGARVIARPLIKGIDRYGAREFYVTFVESKYYVYDLGAILPEPRVILEMGLAESDSFYFDSDYATGRGYVKLLSEDSTIVVQADTFQHCLVFSDSMIFVPDVGPIAQDFVLDYAMVDGFLIPTVEVYQKEIHKLVYCKLSSRTFGTYPFATTGVKEKDFRPQTFHLSQNYPNPFNGETVIDFELEKTSEVSLVVCDVQGREVIKLIQSSLPAGNHRVSWNGVNSLDLQVPSGVYLVYLKAGNQSQSIKAVYER